MKVFVDVRNLLCPHLGPKHSTFGGFLLRDDDDDDDNDNNNNNNNNNNENLVAVTVFNQNDKEFVNTRSLMKRLKQMQMVEGNSGKYGDIMLFMLHMSY